MLHGISLIPIFILLLVKPLNEIITLTLNETDDVLYFNINNSNEYIVELNEIRIGSFQNDFSIKKFKLENNNSLVLKNNITSYIFSITSLEEFKNNHIDRTTYYLGYVLESIDNKVIVKNTNANKLEFINIDSEIKFIDTFDFSLEFLPKFKIEKEFETFNSSIDLFVEEGTYPYLTYSLYSYNFSLTYKKENGLYEYLLKGYYHFFDSLNYIGNNLCEDLFLPSNFKKNVFNVNFTLEIDKYLFSNSYKINIDNLISKNNTYFHLIEEEADEKEKKLIYTT